MNKSKNSPGVGKYKWNKPYEIRGHSKQKSREPGYIDNILSVTNEIPGPQYKLNFDKILDRAPNYAFRKMPSNKGKPPGTFLRNENGVLVNSKVGPAWYKCEDSFSKTQIICKNKLIFNKNKEKRYFDKIVDSKTFVPGVGKYTNLEKALKIVSRPSTAKVKSVGSRK